MASSQGPINSRWFYSLNESRAGSLFGTIKRHQATQYFLVYKMVKERRRYAAFISDVDFFYWYINEPVKEYHEVILGEVHQKPRFDIDLTFKGLPLGLTDLRSYGDAIRSDLIDAIGMVLKSFGYEMDLSKDILICASHNLSEPIDREYSKYSCHMILTRYCVNGSDESEEFFKLVVEAATPLVKEAVKSGVIDPGIFGSLKSFRLLGSTKEGIRPKAYVTSIEHRGNIIQFPKMETIMDQLKIFSDSAVTTVRRCTFLPIKLPPKPEYKCTVNIEGIPNFQGQIESLIDTLDFNIESVKGQLVLLKRLRPSRCPICERDHEFENPYLSISSYGDVYFYCRRLKGASHKIGTIEMGNALKPDAPGDLNSPPSPVPNSPLSISSTPPTPSRIAIVRGFNPNLMREVSSGSVVPPISVPAQSSQTPQRPQRLSIATFM